MRGEQWKRKNDKGCKNDNGKKGAKKGVRIEWKCCKEWGIKIHEEENKKLRDSSKHSIELNKSDEGIRLPSQKYFIQIEEKIVKKQVGKSLFLLLVFLKKLSL